MKVLLLIVLLGFISCTFAIHSHSSDALETPDFGISSLIKESADIAKELENSGSDGGLPSEFSSSSSTVSSSSIKTVPHVYHSGKNVVRHHHKHFHGAAAIAKAKAQTQTIRPRNFKLRAYRAAEREVETRYPSANTAIPQQKDSVTSGLYFSSTDRPRRNPHIEPAYRRRRGVVAHTAPVLNHPLVEDDTRGGRLPSKAELEAKHKECCGAKEKPELKGTTPLTRKLVDTVALLKSILEEKKSALAASAPPMKLPGDDLAKAHRLARRLDRLQEQFNEAPQPGSTMVSRLKRQQKLLKTYNFLKKEIKNVLQNYAMEHGESAIEPQFRHLLPNIADTPQSIVDFYARSTNERIDDPEHPLMLSPQQVHAILKKRVAFDLKRADEANPSKTLLTLKKDGTFTTQYDETGRAVMTMGENDHPNADVRLHVVPGSAVNEDGTIKVGKGFAQQLIDNMMKYNKLRPSFPPKAKNPEHPSQSVAPAMAGIPAGTSAAVAAVKAAAAPPAPPAPAAKPATPVTAARFMQVSEAIVSAAPAVATPVSAASTIPEPVASAFITTQSSPRTTIIEHESDVIIGTPSAALRVPYIMPLDAKPQA